MSLELFFIIITTIYGIIIGSFLNVCIYRIPKHESIVIVPSHCMTCGEHLKWYDLVPLVSFLFLGGKCRYCKTKLSWQYPLIEAANGVAYGVLTTVLIMTGADVKNMEDVVMIILYCMCSSALLALSVIDLRTFEIPIAFNIFIGILGIIRLLTDLENWHVYVIGFFSVGGFLLILYIITKGRGIGGGDVKLMAVAGLLIGWKLIILALVIGCVLGSIIHITLMKIQGKDRMLAFGPYLSAGIYISMLCGTQIVDWYLGMFVK